MMSTEAIRCVAVLTDVLTSLRLAPLVNPHVLLATPETAGLVEQDTCSSLAVYWEALQIAPHMQPAEAIPAHRRLVLSLLRILKALPSQGQHCSVECGPPSPAYHQVLDFFDRLHAHVAAQLGMSAEEDASNAGHYARLRERCERAACERMQLEQKLKLARIEREKQAATSQSAQDHLHDQLEAVVISAQNTRGTSEAGVAAERLAAREAYSLEQSRLSKELSEAHEQLATLREEVRVVELMSLKARRRAAQDREAAIVEYDSELGMRDREFQQALAAFSEIRSQVEANKREAAAMAAERKAHVETLRVAAEAKRREETRHIRVVAAAYLIQNAWRSYKKHKKARGKASGRAGGKSGGRSGGKPSGKAAASKRK